MELFVLTFHSCSGVIVCGVYSSHVNAHRHRDGLVDAGYGPAGHFSISKQKLDRLFVDCANYDAVASTVSKLAATGW